LQAKILPSRARRKFDGQLDEAAWASDSDFYGGKAYGQVFWNFFAVGDAVFDLKADGVLDILDRLFIGLPLAITSLKRGARNEVAVRIPFYDDGKRKVFHN
jgi:hypothetical protein